MCAVIHPVTTHAWQFMAGTPSIPKKEQIDAFLSGRAGCLTDRYLGDGECDLSQAWTARKVDIFDEAKRRGLNAFVALRPTSDGFWLLEAERGYVVFYMERGVRAYHEQFPDLERAFLHWLDQKLRVSGLPVL